MRSAHFSTRFIRKGFTLIELLLVLVILAVLAAVVVPKFTGRAEQARITRAKHDVSTFEGLLDTFEQDTGRYPTSDEGLRALVEAPGNVKSWNGPYMKLVPMDPWDRPYVYKYHGQHNAKGFDVSSMGADGQEGTADDITNWSQQ